MHWYNLEQDAKNAVSADKEVELGQLCENLKALEQKAIEMGMPYVSAGLNGVRAFLYGPEDWSRWKEETPQSKT